jgi:hypothetical protein
MASDQIIVPGVLPPGKLPGQRVAADTEMCPYRVVFCFDQIPNGAIEAIMVRLIRHNPDMQADFTSHIITLCDEDSIAQVFIAENVDLLKIFESCALKALFLNKSRAVSGTGLTMDGWSLVVRSLSKTWLKEIESDLNEMEKSYPGLKREGRKEDNTMFWIEPWNPSDDPSFVCLSI